MSSMRNAVTRRPHRERAQPEGRSKWGLLEKHKDYSLRAQDYNTKKKKLAQLTAKVRDRHPDEFAYGMLNKSSSKQGKHGGGGDENRLSHDAVQLLKTQDAGYLRVALAKGRKDMKRASEELGMAEGKEGKKTCFEDDTPSSPKPARKRKSNGEALDDIDPNEVVDAELPGTQDADETDDEMGDEVVRKKRSKPRAEPSQGKDAAARLRAERKRRRRLQEARKVKLDMLRRRQKEIMAAADQLELQRAQMAKTVGGVNKNGVKFKVRGRKR